MVTRSLGARGAWLVLGLIGCQSASDEAATVGLERAALSACSETVPANRNVDGIPAYTQCATTQDSPIFSNNGVDTSTTRVASDWVQTQFSGGYQCTELAHRYLHFKWQVKWIPNGNAGEWCDQDPPAATGLVKTTSAVHGDLMVLAPGSCGADATYGHVNVIDAVDASGEKLTAVEQNVAGRNMYKASCAKCFLHVVKNAGEITSGSAGSAAAGAGSGGGAAGVGGAGPTAAGAGSLATAPAAGVAGKSAPLLAAEAGKAGSGVLVTPAPAPQAGGGVPQPTPLGEPQGSEAASGCSVAAPGRETRPGLVLLMIAASAAVRRRRRAA